MMFLKKFQMTNSNYGKIIFHITSEKIFEKSEKLDYYLIKVNFSTNKVKYLQSARNFVVVFFILHL